MFWTSAATANRLALNRVLPKKTDQTLPNSRRRHPPWRPESSLTTKRTRDAEQFHESVVRCW